MALELRQQIKMAQQLVITPQLRQAIRLLQLSRMELQEEVQQEMLDNPFLEEAEHSEAEKEEHDDERRDTSSGDEVYDSDLAKDASWEDYLGDFASTTRQEQRERELPAEELSSLEARCAANPTLEGHLLWQLHLSSMTEQQRQIGEEIIGNLDSSGYLQAEIEEIVEQTGASSIEVEEVLSRIQLFDPVGVAARTPSECLMIQLKHFAYDRDPILLDIVQNHLKDLENKRYKHLLNKYNLDIEDLKEYLYIIQSLDPLPGASFGNITPSYISPDVYVYKVGDEFVIVLNEDGIPHLQLSSLGEIVKKSAVSGAEKEYCTEKMRAASWLIKSLYQRQRTLYKVTESVVKHQRSFFEHGISKLAPLVLKDIAEDVAMHESTISRITTNKYVSTPYGVFELKFFFNSGLELEDGSQVSSESVKALIKKFIAEEDVSAPLNDDRLQSMLKTALKVNIARRTVAKYRSQLGIPSSNQRRICS